MASAPAQTGFQGLEWVRGEAGGHSAVWTGLFGRAEAIPRAGIGSGVALKTAAGTAAGAESTSEAERDTCRLAVTKAFTRSALWLAWHFNGEESKLALYCPVHLLKNAQAQVPGTCSIVVSGGEGSITTTGHASGADLIQWYQRLVGTTAWLELGNGPADEEVTFDTLPPGSYEVKAHGVNDEGPGADNAVGAVTVT